MQMEKLIKKQITLSIFSFVLIGSLIIGTSVAYLRGVTTTSSYKSKIGKLDVLFTNGDTINLSTDPLEDEVAISNTDNIYNFQVKNNGEANVFPCLNDPASSWWESKDGGNVVIEDPAYIVTQYGKVMEFLNDAIAKK